MICGLILGVIYGLAFGVIRPWYDMESDTWCDKLIHGMIQALLLGIIRSTTHWV